MDSADSVRGITLPPTFRTQIASSLPKKPRARPLSRCPSNPTPLMESINLGLLEPKKARIEIIPLIDVVFFLLATFVLFTLSLDRISALPAKLPVGGVDPSANVLLLQVSEGGTVYWKSDRTATPEVISRTELSARLAEYRRTTAVPRVLVRGDNKSKFGEAVAVFDEVRKVGITEVSIETLVSGTGR